MNALRYSVNSLVIVSVLVLFNYGCSMPERPAFQKSGCVSCHSVVLSHGLACDVCHGGNSNKFTKQAAHAGFVVNPASPQHMRDTCGSCHTNEARNAAQSSHFTLINEIQKTWKAFFPEEEMNLNELQRLAALPYESMTPRRLVADMLVRRCLRCHPYTSGDDYTMTHRKTGCAACHRIHEAGGIKRVANERCLACHYANFVGWDYCGRFEKDYEEDYRAPLEQGRISSRPYGVEWHEMTPDVHKRAGLSCTDCHVMGPCQEKNGQKQRLECVDCHTSEAKEAEQHLQSENAVFQQKMLRFNGTVMQPQRVGHREQDRHRVSCAACHAVWSVQDIQRSLTLQESPVWEEWSYLMVQGSSEVERIVAYHLLKQGFWQPFEPGMEIADSMAVLMHKASCSQEPCMTNKFSGDCGNGVWFEAFLQRRWAPVPLGMSEDGRISVMRPILNLELFYVNKDGRAVINALRPVSGQMQPYTPHTIGKADEFRSREVAAMLLR